LKQREISKGVERGTGRNEKPEVEGLAPKDEKL